MKTYRLYPSLFDAYVYMTEAEDEEQLAKRKQALLDSLNRIEGVPSEAMARGTVLNAIVDAVVTKSMDYDLPTYFGSHEGFDFLFDGELVRKLADRFAYSLCQTFTSANILTSKGLVKLYGYPDYVCGDIVFDLKTTASYTFGKYRNKWQSKVYPYCLVMSEAVQTVTEFQYIVAEVGKPNAQGVITGEVYKESYYYTFGECSDAIRSFLEEDLLPFIEDNRSAITNNQIFNI